MNLRELSKLTKQELVDMCYHMPATIQERDNQIVDLKQNITNLKASLKDTTLRIRENDELSKTIIAQTATINELNDKLDIYRKNKVELKSVIDEQNIKINNMSEQSAMYEKLVEEFNSLVEFMNGYLELIKNYVTQQTTLNTMFTQHEDLFKKRYIKEE